MGKHHLRKDPTCLNCGYIVANRYCSYCGQENTESRQSFVHLVQHFFEDFTHYEGRFWRTVILLLKKPGYLTRAFLKGKRNRYVPPVKLYIFMAFVTFLLPHLLPDYSEPVPLPPPEAEVLDTIPANDWYFSNNGGEQYELNIPAEYKSVKEFDSIQALLPENQRMDWIEKKMTLQSIKLLKYSPREQALKFFHSFKANFPKTLFLYMPLFAFFIWLFHSKKRWFYFDHAILTLHYFSFIMLVFSLFLIALTIVQYLYQSREDERTFGAGLFFISSVFIFIYFFIAHKKFYAENFFVSFIKGSVILTINLFLFFILLMGFGFLTIFLIE